MYGVQILFYLCLLSESVVFGLLKYSKTKNEEWCMSECIHYKDYNYCYKDWSNWDYCIPGNIPVNSIKSVNPSVKCTSHCGKYGEKYNWCLTGEVGYSSWDYCTPEESFNYDNFETSSLKVQIFQGWKKTFYIDPGEDQICPNIGSFSTRNNKNNTLYQPPWFLSSHLDSLNNTEDGLKIKIKIKRSPQSDNINLLTTAEIINRVLSGNLGDRGFYQFATPPRIVSEAIAFLSTLWPNRVVTPNQEPSQPIINHFVAPAPPIPGQPENVPLTQFIQARIYRRHLGYPRHRMPGCTDCHMDNLDRRLGDQRGHLLAVSLGGGNDLFNIVPQPTGVNVGIGSNSFWRCTERDIVNYLEPLDQDDNQDDGRYIEWRLVVQYGNRHISRRPTGFFLQLTYFDSQGNMVYNSPDMYFSN